MHRLARNNTRSLNIGHATLRSVNRALAVNRVTQTIDNTTEQGVAGRNVHDRLGAFDNITFFDRTVVTKDNDTNVINLKVQGHPTDAARKLDHFTGLNIIKPVRAGDTIANRQHAPDFRHLGFLPEILDLLFEDRRDLSSLDTHYPTSFIEFWSAASLERIDVSIIFEPTFTTRPPISESSTATFSFTVFPSDALSVFASFSA